jgi:hypothetical protein
VNKEQKYIINKIDVNSNKEVFSTSDQIRLREKDNASTNLLLSKEGIPKYTYENSDLAKLSKVQVPREKFDVLSMSLLGDRIALTSLNADTTYVGVTKIDDKVIKKIDVRSKQSKDDGQATTQGKEICVGSNVTSYDLIKNVKVDLTCFSLEGKQLLIQYKDANGVNSIKLYDMETTKLIPFKFDENYPANEFDVTFENFEKDKLVFNLKHKDANGGVDNISLYELDLKNFEVNQKQE